MAAAAAALLGMGGAATAADMYSGGGLKDVPAYVPPPLWTGFYIGGHMGIAWSRLDLDGHNFTACVAAPPTPDDPADPVICSNGSFGKGNLDSTNGFGGGQFGYNFQGGNGGLGGNFLGSNFVFGVEVDLGAVALNQHNNRFVSTPVGGTFVGMALDGHDDGGFYGDVTGRLGYAWGSALIYAKGGFAFLDVGNRLRETVFFSDGTARFFDGHNNNDNFVTGWTVGGGLEWKVGPSWSIKAEYLHFDFSNDNNDNCCNDGFFNNFHDNAHLTADTVKLGFNYFWNAPAAPLPPAPLK
jgi:opacity protein-like surface antigen